MCGDRLTQKNTLKKCMTCKISKGKPGGKSEVQKKKKRKWKEKEQTNNRGIKKKIASPKWCSGKIGWLGF